MVLSNSQKNEIQKLIDESVGKKDKSNKRVYAITAIASCALISIIFAILIWDFQGDENSTVYVWKIAFIGIITFFGMLMISSYHSEHHPHHRDGSKGVMRRGIASSFVVTFFIVLSLVLFPSTNIEQTPYAEKILENFTNIIIVIIGFYFGSKGAIELYKHIRKDDVDNSENNKEPKNIKNVKAQPKVKSCVITSPPQNSGKKGLTFSHEGHQEREAEIKWNKPEVTYAIIKGTEDIRENSDVTEKTAMNLAMLTWGLEMSLKLKLVKKDENPDITVNFKHSDEDDYLAKRKSEGTNILGYAFPPGHPMQGTLVLNDDYLWTVHGESVPAWKIYPTHYSPGDPQTTPSYNLTSTLIHELGHTLGMPHIDDCPECIMYPNDNANVDLNQREIDIIRAKYGQPSREQREYDRLKEWLSKRVRRKDDDE